ncbi:DotU family type IV/VI secretion system protein [Orrella daihaiensis]|uniref:DotU family type IV/VI secretion system protein n=1 Tax=Orrella daihaiensis TaxID=2782176 RepID=A0ABY4AJ10_9BURK|nr:DotU family type IV/VI secretion system protein [Orrella daihaiensis]UOD50063.1 DotU family type IV/VI secretion system protein [Orrella daihaiensis]
MKLTSLFVPLMAYVQGLERQEMPQAQVIHDELQRLIKRARDIAVSQGAELEQFHAALFPVVAWIDERLSVLPQWQESRPWRSLMLQRKLFSTSLAGVQFFERLEKLEPSDIDVREVFVTCLALGFLGRYSLNPNSPELMALRQAQYKLLRPELLGTSDNASLPLFPEAYRLVTSSVGRRHLRLSSRFFWLLVIVVPVFVIGALAYWFDHQLGEQVSEITRRLP